MADAFAVLTQGISARSLRPPQVRTPAEPLVAPSSQSNGVIQGVVDAEHEDRGRRRDEESGGLEGKGVRIFRSVHANGGEAETPCREKNDASTTERRGSKKRSREDQEEEEKAASRKRLGIRLKPARGLPAAALTFDAIASLGRGKDNDLHRIVSSLSSEIFAAPTAVQAQAIPLLLSGRDIMAIAPTGSGKTLAFLLPMLALLQVPLKARRAEGKKKKKAVGPRGLVVSPTRELATQTARVLAGLTGGGSNWRCSLVTKASLAGVVWGQVDIAVATPQRILTGLKEKGDIFALSQVRMLVLDEADKLFEVGKDGGEEMEGTSFLSQLDKILAACSHAKIVRALFTATLPEGVEALAKQVLADPVRLTVGERDAAALSVEQRLTFCGNEGGKLTTLREMLKAGGVQPPILVFVQSKERATELYMELAYDGVPLAVLHAGRTAEQRDKAVNAFRRRDAWVMICTDLIARGMDFQNVNCVISYDIPTTTSAYIHRVGRAGRAGKKGHALTLFTEEDVPMIRPIINIIQRSGGSIPDWMMHLPKQRKHRRNEHTVAPARATISSSIKKRENFKFKRRMAKKG